MTNEEAARPWTIDIALRCPGLGKVARLLRRGAPVAEVRAVAESIIPRWRVAGKKYRRWKDLGHRFTVTDDGDLRLIRAGLG